MRQHSLQAQSKRQFSKEKHAKKFIAAADAITITQKCENRNQI
jgi:hypothetical protein